MPRKCGTCEHCDHRFHFLIAQIIPLSSGSKVCSKKTHIMSRKFAPSIMHDYTYLPIHLLCNLLFHNQGQLKHCINNHLITNLVTIEDYHAESMILCFGDRNVVYTQVLSMYEVRCLEEKTEKKIVQWRPVSYYHHLPLFWLYWPKKKA